MSGTAKESDASVAVVFAPRPDGSSVVTAEATLSALRALVRGRTSDAGKVMIVMTCCDML